MFDNILEYAQVNKCSDVHLTAGRKPIVRRVGELQIMDDLPPYTDQTLYPVISKVLAPEQLTAFDSGLDIDTAYTDARGNRYRLNIYRQQGHYALALRLLANRIPTIDELGLPEILKNMALLPRGMVLVTGPTGSGKSTTLAAIIDYINEHEHKHILTLEDPIEYQHQSKQCMVNQREVHKDVRDFQSALRSAMREDPDVILVGEMRDYETISLAVTAAETGHLVFSTLHTTGAANTIDRIIDVFPPHQQAQIRTQLSGVLKGVVSQVLLPTVDHTKRIAIHEIMIMTDAIGNMIRDNKVYQINTVIQTGMKSGMQTLDSNLARLIRDGVISRESAEEVSVNPELLKRLCNNIAY